MMFSWDSRKAESNLRKHGVAFDEAITVFSDPPSSTPSSRSGWTYRDPASMKPATLPGPALDPWAKRFLLTQGILVSLLAVTLFFAPAWMSTLWPWQVTPTLAQMYAGPLLAYGIGSSIYSKQGQWSGVRSIAPAMLSFTMVTVIVSFMHVKLFSFTGIADWLWFAWFIIASAFLGVMTLRSIKD